MAHSHANCPSHSIKNTQVLKVSFAIITAFMVVEYLGGYFFNSLALMADAGHMLNDSISLGLALFALTIAAKNIRLSKWLAFINGASLLIIAAFIIWEAIERLQNPPEMKSLPMLMVATLGLIVNIIVAKMMLSADHDNLNIRAAYLHVMADLLGSVVAILSGLSALFFGWLWVDPLASLLLSLIILRSGWQVTVAAMQALSQPDDKPFNVHAHSHGDHSHAHGGSCDHSHDHEENEAHDHGDGVKCNHDHQNEKQPHRHADGSACNHDHSNDAHDHEHNDKEEKVIEHQHSEKCKH